LLSLDHRNFTFAGPGFLVELVSHVADALVGAKHVEARSTLAQSWEIEALIDILQENGDRIWNKANTARAKSIVLRK